MVFPDQPHIEIDVENNKNNTFFNDMPTIFEGLAKENGEEATLDLNSFSSGATEKSSQKKKNLMKSM